ncbi:PREDICTED: uncharacterized protein LOC106745946 [Dinoponera quadriceps]|uniref:Uncharacterized protein LOC106745946 n=1 Tax=Dinoponera quadriceps TaxID=609295 RepID=A0A6P3XGE0_DINQU|nr:PREDICTED: uncharacterized protein LOC106745946 [Dinoponera quadriceps]
MRDTSDMMEDALSEDTMMDCGGDGGGLEDFVDLATDITDSSPTIRDAAERLLTLLGVDDGDEDLVSSSEDEGVEVDIDDLEDDDEETGNARLLHHLAASLAQELKYSSTRSSPSTSGRGAHQARGGSAHCVEMLQDTSYLERGCLQDQAEPKAPVHQQSDFFARSGQLFEERSTAGRTKSFLSFDAYRQDRQEQRSRSFEPKDAASHAFPGYICLDQRLRTGEQAAAQPDNKYFGHQQQDTDSWAAGWDACANEALRYLVEDEGLPLHHPTVIAMKNHLDLQRERAFAQHTGYTEAKSQDMNLALD